ncbi:MAG: D-aminoacyl-tRNA deacylase [Acidimicrobiia bacterium]
MRTVIQRVSEASVDVHGSRVARISAGIVALVAVVPADTQANVGATVDKIANLRIFSDEDGRMNRSLIDIGGEILVVSQFTLAGAITRGRRPSFAGAATPETAEPMVDDVAAGFAALGLGVATGVFGAKMQVALVNDGPVTFVVDTAHGSVVG